MQQSHQGLRSEALSLDVASSSSAAAVFSASRISPVAGGGHMQAHGTGVSQVQGRPAFS
ncbi:MAG: hypothetical protein IPI20_09275 [Rhodoferax sp.]|nr:hypothetical protein [Rhodoferax sp.]